MTNSLFQIASLNSVSSKARVAVSERADGR